MKASIGGSQLLYMVTFFAGIIILVFVGIISYSKAYKVKNRIVEIIERQGVYSDAVAEYLNEDLRKVGYRTATEDQIRSKCTGEGSIISDKNGFLYCVYVNASDPTNLNDSHTYTVVTYIHFDIPIIGDTLVFPVKGETKMLGKDYNY